MKIVNLKQLCKEPDGTLFACIKENHEAEEALPLQIKLDTFKYSDGSFHFNGLCGLNPIPRNDFKIEHGVEYEVEMFPYDGADHDLRDSGYDKFVIYNINEINMIIDTLKWALERQDEFDAEKLYKCK